MPQNDARSALPIPVRLGAHARDIWHGHVTRRLSSSARSADSLLYRPVSLDVGSVDEAQAMLRGYFSFSGHTIKVERDDPWQVFSTDMQWNAELHGFEWLKHFRAGDGPASRKAVRRYTDAWLHAHGNRGGFSWRPAITGERVTSWCMSARMLMENAEPVYRSSFLKSLGVQGRYLAKTASSVADPMDRMRSAMGTIYAGLCLPGETGLLSSGLEVFIKAAEKSALADAGPVSHNPSDLLDRIARLCQVRADLKGSGHEDKAALLTPMIAKAVPVLRMMQHGDGGLALFHGGVEEGAEKVSRVLVNSAETAPALAEAYDTGLIRMSSGRTNVLLDVADTPAGRYARTAHAAPLAIEVSVSGQRLITNCGSGVHLGGSWENSSRVSAAHSTLTLAEDSAVGFSGSSRTRMRSLNGKAQVFERDRETDDNGTWVLAAHDGYAADYGLLHYRRLFLAPDGTDLRGEDTLSLVKGGAKILERSRAKTKTPYGPAFAVRFHLHPDISVEQSDKMVILGLANGERWQMVISGGQLIVDDSIYIPRRAGPLETKQVVIKGMLKDAGAQVRWAMRRIRHPGDM